jgi:hypothetical protein
MSPVPDRHRGGLRPSACATRQPVLDARQLSASLRSQPQSVLTCLPRNQAEHLALLVTDQFMERSRRRIAGKSSLHGTAGSTRRRLRDHMIHVISPRHLAVSRQPGPHPQASRTAQPPDPGPPFPCVCDGLQPRDHRPITAQHLRAVAQVMLLHTHPARLTGSTAADADGNIDTCQAQPDHDPASPARQYPPVPGGIQVVPPRA